ncbi:ABC transporter ATP-binding protein [Vallitalea okinawensis]|uniref:ABC transporter ATP-binding protein n=1 Tax=Vallitalea okinawensis TaxID=2078660 RepID=UPI000CFD6951|nr:ABC transporter ATP-binding protein [Vallitalea okinawensis]
MMGNIVLSMKNISKCYKIYDKPQDRLKESLFNRIKRKKFAKEHWALKDINIDIKQGETFGIIGVNGSGKSTLLQMIASILKPTNGELKVNGKIAALLELGSGFNPNYTGRENIYLNASLLGLSKDEIEEKIADIVGFADIGEFIDSPVKTYSSGMFVRVAFAVAINVNADILLIDEALAVGDVFFRQKCYQKLNELREKGVTIIFVSHSMGEVEQFCKRTVLLNAGEAIFVGDTREAVRKYYLLQQGVKDLSIDHNIATNNYTNSNFKWPKNEAFFHLHEDTEINNGYAKCVAVGLCDDEGNPCRVFKVGDKAVFYYEFEILKNISTPIGGVVIYSDKAIIVHGKSTMQYNSEVPMYVSEGSVLRFRQEILLGIQEGEYTFEVGLSTMDPSNYSNKENMYYEELCRHEMRLCHRPMVGTFNVILNKGGKPTELLHHGIANLPGKCELEIR